MAGMLPGVEAARRRRFHQNSSNATSSSSSWLSSSSSSSSSSFTRRSSFCLYATANITHDFHLSNSNSPMRKGICDESKLGVEAREAKKRLDQRLWRSSRSLEGDQARLRPCEEEMRVPKKESKRLRWLKLMSWKSSEAEECAVCLEQLKAAPPSSSSSETLMHLPCGHRFHTNCLLPWLQANALCPCCRMLIPSSFFLSKSNQL